MNNIDFKKLGDYVKIKTGKLDANASSEDGEYPFFTCSIEPLKISSYSYDCECCLVAGNGDLNVKYYNGKFDAYQRTYIIESLDKEKLDVMYLYFFLSSYIEVLRKQSIGGVIKYIKLGNLTDALIPIPELSKQKEICQNLIKAKKILSSNENLLSKYDTLIKSRFIEMFGDIQTYKKEAFKDCSLFIDYRGHTPEVTETGEIRMINAKSVGKGFFKYINEYITKEIYDVWMHRGFPKANDVLFVTEGHTFGNTCQVPSDFKIFALGQRVITIRGNEGKLNNFYLNSYMQTDDFNQDINKYKTGGTAQGIRSKDLIKVEIPIPPYEKQLQFAAFVQQIDKSKKRMSKFMR